MMSEKKKNTKSHLSRRRQSTARKDNLSKQISSHCENTAQTLSQITDAEIQKNTSHTKAIDEDKHVRIKINLNRLTSEIIHDISKNPKPATPDLTGAKESDTMHGVSHSRKQRESCNQKSMTGNTKAKPRKNVPEVQKCNKENVNTTSQSAVDKNSEVLYLSDQMHDLLGDSKLTKAPIENEDIHATFSFENTNAEMNDAHKQVSEQHSKNVCVPFYYNKTPKRNKRNLCWTAPTFVCNISDEIQPEVAEGIVDRSSKSIVIGVVPSLNKNTPKRNRLTYKVQYRMSLKSKIYPDESDKTNAVVGQLKRKPVLSISPIIYEHDRLVTYNDIRSKKVKLPLSPRPLDFLIPINATIRDRGYTEKCIAERITFEELSHARHESWVDNGVDKETDNCEMDVNIQKPRKRYSNDNIPYENKRKRIPAIQYHDTIKKNEELLHSMRTPQKDLLKTNYNDRIIKSQNKPIGTIKKYQKDASLSKRVNSDVNQNVKLSREILTLTKNMPWDFALRTSQIVMPVTVELDKVGMNTSENLTNEIIIPEVVDEVEDNVLETRNVFETSTRDHPGRTMIPVSETNVIENDVGEIVNEVCDTLRIENVRSMPDIEEDDEEIDNVAGICLDDEFLYPLPEEGSIWQITIDDSGTVLYENIRPDDDTDGESANEQSESVDNQVENRVINNENQNEESPLLDIIKSSDSDAETEKYEEEIAETDVGLIKSDEEVSEMKMEFCEELIIDLTDEEKKPILETPFYDEENTVELDIRSLSNIEKHGELDFGTEIVDKRQTVDTDVQSIAVKEEISMEMYAESYLYNQDQTVKSKMKNNNEIRDNPVEGTKINNNSEHDKLVNSFPIRNQNELNFHANAENQSAIENTIPEVRRTSATTFEIRFNDFPQITPLNYQPEVVLENVVLDTNINDISSYAQKKEAEKQRNIDCQSMSMVLQNTTEQTEDQSVTRNDHWPLTTVHQQQVTGETQQPVIKQFQQPDTREFPQFITKQLQQRVIGEPRQLVPRKPQESVITEPQLPLTRASSGILQTGVNNQNTNTYPVPTNATSEIIQQATENQMPRVPLQIAGAPTPNSHMSGYTQNYSEMHQMLNSQIPSISNAQATQRSETGEMRQLLMTGNNYGMEPQNNEQTRLQTPVQNHNLPIPYTAQNVQHQQNGPIAGRNHGETDKITSLNDRDIRVRPYNGKQVSHIPSQENNMGKQNLYQNPVAQHINQPLSNDYPRPIESVRSVVAVNQHTGNTVAQIPYQGHNMNSQYSNQHLGIPQNRQMSNNQTVQSGQHQPREYASYNEMNVPRMDLPRTGMVSQQNNQTQIVTNNQPIPEPTRYGSIHSTQSDPMLPMSNNGGTMGPNGNNVNQNPSIQPVNNPYAVVPYRNVNNLPSRNSPLQHNGAAINNNMHSYQPSVQNHPAYLPPPYQGHMQYNTQPLPNNHMDHTSTSLQIIHQQCINANILYRRIMTEQQNQLQAMNTKIEELNVALQKKPTPRRGRKKNDNNNEAIPPVVQNHSQQRLLENTGQQVMPTPQVPSEDHNLTSQNHLTRNNPQQVGPVPHIPSEEHRLASRNQRARNNPQQMGPVPHIPSEEHRLASRNQRARNNPQQMGPVPHIPSEEHRLASRNDSQQMGPVPHIPSEEHRLASRNDSQQMGPVPHTPSDEHRSASRNHRARNNPQQIMGPVPHTPSEEHSLASRNHRARNSPQQMGPVPHTPSEEHRLASRNHRARNNLQQMGPMPHIPSEEHRLASRNDSQQMGPVPYIPFDEHRLASRNHRARNNPQQMGPMPHIPSEEHRLASRNDSQQMGPVPHIPSDEHRLASRNHRARNSPQQMGPVPHTPSEEHRLASRNHFARNDSQQMSPVPHIPSEEHRLASRNHLARNNPQQMGPMPHAPSQENYLKYPDRPPGMDSQQVYSIPPIPLKERYIKYRNRPVWKESQEVSSPPLVSPEESSSTHSNRSQGIDSQRPVTRTHFEEQYLKHNNHPPVQQGTQERYILPSGRPAGPAQNVMSAPSVYYPKPEALGSQNVSVVQPSVSLDAPSQSKSHNQPQRSHPASIYNRPVRNEAAATLQNLNVDKMHAQGKLPDPSQSRNNDLFKITNLCNLDNNSTAQSNYPVNQLSNENGPINLSIHDKNERNKPQQDNNVSDEATSDATGRKINNQAAYEYIELEALRKHLQKKQSAAPRNESRDSGYVGSPGESEERHIICLRCGGPSFFKCSQCLKTFYCSTECQHLLRKNDIARCCLKQVILKLN